MNSWWEGDCILLEEEESWWAERAGNGVLYSIDKEGGSVSARGRESDRKSKRRHRGNGRSTANFGSWLALRTVEGRLIVIKGGTLGVSRT